MPNKWNIPAGLELEVRGRDARCIYCGVDFAAPPERRGQRPSWEHIVNDAKIVTIDNIAICCISCNASKGAKPLIDWLQSKYCDRKGINQGTVAKVVQDALSRMARSSSA